MAFKREILLFLLVLLKLALTTSSFAYPIALPGCRDKCGDTSIPYPFGLKPGCYMEGFDLTCNSTNNRAYIAKTDVELRTISILPAEAITYRNVRDTCFSGIISSTSNYTSLNLTDSPAYLVSSKRNMLTALGCDTAAYLLKDSKDTFAAGCMTYCASTEGISNGSCSGIACCHADVPEGLDFYAASLFHLFNLDSSNPCKFAFVADKEWYNFNTTDLVGTNFFDRLEDRQKAPMVLDWAIRNGSCQDTMRPPKACASQYSTCYNTTNGVGYLCNCTQGFEGNPYLLNGCVDINECNLPNKFYCAQGRCVNTLGDYECKCPIGQHGDGKIGSCTAILSSAAKASIGVAVCVVVVLALSFFVVTKLQSRKHQKEKEEFFKKNGGQQLQELLAGKQVEAIRVFTKTELELATNNFDKGQVIGSGGGGMVYRGTLDTGRVAAIKTSKQVNEGQKDEFANEIVILSQINHRNVVRLLGCCLEVVVPMLVYEFISHGTLFSFLHDKNRATKIPLNTRLRIARESAEALAFVHTSLNRPIIHGDVKSLNILLDDNLTIKVADFGASSLVPLDKNQFVKFVQGTKGYLDPECFYTNQLTDKSDVFAFGVVILELVTRKPAMFIDETGEQKSLLNVVRTVVKENRLDDFLDPEITNETSKLVLREVVELALWCIKLSGEERPTMIEVAQRLQVLAKSTSKHPDKNQDEAASSVSEISPNYGDPDSLALPTTENASVLHIDHIDIGR